MKGRRGVERRGSEASCSLASLTHTLRFPSLHPTLHSIIIPLRYAERPAPRAHSLSLSSLHFVTFMREGMRGPNKIIIILEFYGGPRGVATRLPFTKI